MAKKRNKKKLTSEQANRISLAISAIFFIYVLVRGIVVKTTGDDALFYWGICCLGTILIYGLFYFFIFKVDDKKREEKDKEREILTMQYLSYTEYKQVYFTPESHGKDMDMVMSILRKQGCEFYAKIAENKNIYLIAIDKHDEIVFEDEIDNHVYFNSRFNVEK